MRRFDGEIDNATGGYRATSQPANVYGGKPVDIDPSDSLVYMAVVDAAFTADPDDDLSECKVFLKAGGGASTPKQASKGLHIGTFQGAVDPQYRILLARSPKYTDDYYFVEWS